MSNVQYPDALKVISDRIVGNGIEIIFCQHENSSPPAKTTFDQHALVIVLEGEVSLRQRQSEHLRKGEAMMIRKNSSLTIESKVSSEGLFRCLYLFFDDQSLNYALDGFDPTPAATGISHFKVPLNEHLQEFTQSLMTHYRNFNSQHTWAHLLESKLRELIWIFFHSELREKAFSFFRVSAISS